MQKYKKPDINESKIGINPFTVSLVIEVNKNVIPNAYKQEDGIWVQATIEQEVTPFVKVYRTVEHRKVISSLSGPAMKLLEHVRNTVECGCDYLWINKERFMEENSMSLNTYKKAIQQLCLVSILYKMVNYDYYWINPDYFFFGSRVKKYPNKVIEK